MSNNPSLYETLWRWTESRRVFVAATVVATRGSAPRDPGAKMLIPSVGDPIGTIGGGAPERRVLEAAHDLLDRGGPPQVLRIDLSEEAACGGMMEVFLEPYRSEKQIAVVGAGHVGRAVAPLLASLGWDVTVIDPRPERLTDPAFARCRTVDAPFPEAAERIAFSDGLFILIMTPEHRFDEEIAACCVEKPWRWLGVIGSQRKATQIRQHLLAKGLPEDRVARVRTPVGLEIGSDTPDEIAISIAAELIRETARPRAPRAQDA